MSSTEDRAAFDLARTYRKLAAKLDDYLHDNYDSLTRRQRFQLMQKEGALEDAAAQLTLSAASELLSGLGPSLGEIRRATAEVNRALDHLDRVDDVINAGTHAVQLVAALVAQDLGKVGEHAAELGKAAAKLTQGRVEA
jgi:ABC-type transporter Mla subunit MlaD